MGAAQETDIRPVEKKLRKRKELDALVANMSKARKRSNGYVVSSPSPKEHLLNSKTTNGNAQAIGQLTDVSYYTSTEGEEGHSGHGGGSGRAIIHLEGGMSKIRSSSTSVTLFCNACKGLWVMISIAVAFLIVFLTFSLHVQMKLDMQDFRATLNRGEL